MNEYLDSIASLYKIEPELLQIETLIKQSSEIDNILTYMTKIKRNNQNFHDTRNEVTKLFSEYFTLDNVLYYPLEISKWPFKAKKTHQELQTKKLTSPLNIPITPHEIQNEINGIVQGGTIIKNQTPTRLVKNISITNCTLAKDLYAHEIAHTQQLTADPTINYLNEEVLSIFLERLAKDYFSENKDIIYLRLNDLLSKINILKNTGYTDDEIKIYQKLKSLVYIESTLKAYLLYHLYQTEPLTSKKAQIIDEINEVFNKQQPVEELLTKQGITRENCKTEFIKTLTRR